MFFTATGLGVDVGGIDANALLVCHFDGTDAATTSSDSSSYGRTLSFVGSAQIDTAQSKFGASSLLLDGSGDLVRVTPEGAFDFASGDFTLEAWIRLNTTGANMGILGGKRTDNSAWSPYSLWVTSGNKLSMRGSNANNGDTFMALTSGTTNLTTGTWYHVAWVKNGTSNKLYLNGTEEASATSSGAPENTAVSFIIGATTNDAFESFNGWIDEVRVSDVARWTSNFTPSTQPYS